MLREATSRVAGEALALAAGCLFRTLHFEVVGRDPVLALAAAGRAVVLVGWHGHDLIHLAAFPTLLPGRRGAIIVEDNVAGHALMVSAARWKVDGTALSLAADSTRSARGIVRFVALVRSGRFGLLAVDGPAGPARQVKPGAAFIALRAEAVLGDHDVGIFVATGGFTNDAQKEWRSQQQRKVTLLDMRQLVELWVRHYEKLTDDARRLLPLRPVYYLAPRD